MLDQAQQDDLLALLAWWRAAGVDAAIDETAADWSASPERWPGKDFVWPGRQQATTPQASREAQPAGRSLPTAPRQPTATSAPQVPSAGAISTPPPLRPDGRPAFTGPAAPSPRPFTAVAPDAATMAAREAAARAGTLDELRDMLAAFDGCGLKATAKSLCFYRGSAKARVLIIGEAPGRDEDIEGRPFVGAAGRMLDKMLAAIGLGETDVHITNIVYWRPPGNRTPTPQEAQVCRPFLDRQIALVEPDLVVTLGGPATKAILDVADGIMKVRGKWREVELGGATRPVMATLHPAYLLRTPPAKRQAWRDLLAVKARLAGRS